MFVKPVPALKMNMLKSLDTKIQDRLLERQQAEDVLTKANQFLNAAKEERRRYEALVISEACSGIAYSSARLTSDYQFFVVEEFA